MHQSTTVVPYWTVPGDTKGRWEVTISMKLDVSRAEARLLAGARG